MIDFFVSNNRDQLELVTKPFQEIVQRNSDNSRSMIAPAVVRTHALKEVIGSKGYNKYIQLAQISGKKYGIQLISVQHKF